MALSEVLEDSYVYATDPVVTAGVVEGRDVRWVHASEQLDIATLLRGGELILMEAVNLRSASEAEQAEYLDSLRVAEVAGLAIETTEGFPRIPPALIAHADASGFPVIELRRRVPFVQICESINSQLADSSLRRLQIADRLSLALSESVRELVGIEAILSVLSRETRSAVVLTSLSGVEIGSAGGPVERGPAGSAPVFSAPVSFGGTVVATLSLRPATDADIYLITAALHRAPEILAIALLDSRPPSAEDRATSRFFSLLGSDPDAADVAAATSLLGFDRTEAFLTVVVTLEDVGDALTVQDALGEPSSRVGQLVGTEYTGVLRFPSWSELEERRPGVVAALTALTDGRRGLRAAIGPGARDTRALARCLRSAQEMLRLPAASGTVLDARTFALARLWQELDGIDSVPRFIDEQIGGLLDRGDEAPGALFDTLAAYVLHWGSKTDAARALDIQRQTLYQRLDRIFAIIGPLPAGSARIPAIVTALFLEQGRRQFGTDEGRTRR